MDTARPGEKTGQKPAHRASAHGHPAHPHRPPARKKSHGKWIAAVVALLVAVCGGWWLSAGSGSDDLTPEERLVQQMRDAATGAAPPVHVFGGELKAVYGDRGMTVMVKGVPSKACVSAAWRLAREGVVSVNGTTPMRISAAILSELCAEEADGTTITWSPREDER